MKFSTKWYYIKETFTSLKRNSLMSIASISTVALSILVLGMFLTMVLNVNNLASHLENQVQVTIYMEDSASAEQLKQMEKVLRSTPGIVKVTPRTREQALADFKKRLGEQQKLLAALGEDNPFPASFEIQVDNPERIPQLVPQFQQMPGVETAKFGQEVVEHLFQLTRVLRIGGVLLIILLAIAYAVSVGGMGMRPGRSMLYKNIAASCEERSALQQLSESGCPVYCQILPSDKPVDIRSL